MPDISQEKLFDGHLTTKINDYDVVQLAILGDKVTPVSHILAPLVGQYVDNTIRVGTKSWVSKDNCGLRLASGCNMYKAAYQCNLTLFRIFSTYLWHSCILSLGHCTPHTSA